MTAYTLTLTLTLNGVEHRPLDFLPPFTPLTPFSSGRAAYTSRRRRDGVARMAFGGRNSRFLQLTYYLDAVDS